MSTESPADRLDLPGPAVHLRRPGQHADPRPAARRLRGIPVETVEVRSDQPLPDHRRHLPARRRRGRPAGARRPAADRRRRAAPGGRPAARSCSPSAPATSCSAARSSPRAPSAPAWACSTCTPTGARPGPSASCAGDVDPRLGLPPLTGFENHGGRTHLGPGVAPLARVTAGIGNDGTHRGRLARQAARHVLARPGAGPQPGARRPAAALGHRGALAAAGRRRLVRAAAHRARWRPYADRDCLAVSLPRSQRPARRFAALVRLIAAVRPDDARAPRPTSARCPGWSTSSAGSRRSPPCCVGALLMIVLVPRTLITVAWGALFGAVGGAGYTLAAALIAALLGFAVGRWLGRDFVAERVRGRLARLDGWFARQSVLGVITVRLLPVGGFGLVELRVRHHRRAAAAVPARQRARPGAVRLRLRGHGRGGQLAGRHQLARGRPRHLRALSPAR